MIYYVDASLDPMTIRIALNDQSGRLPASCGRPPQGPHRVAKVEAAHPRFEP